MGCLKKILVTNFLTNVAQIVSVNVRAILKNDIIRVKTTASTFGARYRKINYLFHHLAKLLHIIYLALIPVEDRKIYMLKRQRKLNAGNSEQNFCTNHFRMKGEERKRERKRDVKKN